MMIFCDDDDMILLCYDFVDSSTIHCIYKILSFLIFLNDILYTKYITNTHL